MSDSRKKKNVPHKETAPRRPVILKYDRETILKETDKDSSKVVEKEIQPTILIKAREPCSTSKENDNRPASPKRNSRDNEIESQVIQPSKIVHNEDKPREKKVPETKVLQAETPVMTDSVKLLTESLEFNSAAIEHLQDTNTNYLVVGVLGLQGVGKSTILNLLASENIRDNICSQILNSHDITRDSSNEMLEDIKYLSISEKLPNSANDKINTPRPCFKFKTQDADQIERGLHCTTGVDMYVTRSRVILLDACAAGSASLLDSSQERLSHTDALQAAALLLAVCHVVILVQDWFLDHNIVRFIQAAEMLKPSLPPLGASALGVSPEGDQDPEEHQPHLLLLHNRCTLDDFRPASVRVMQELYNKVFERSSLQLHSGMYLYSPDSSKAGLNPEALCHNLNAEACGKPINLFLMPEIYEDQENSDMYRGHPPPPALARRLRWQLLGARASPHSPPSERAWAHHVARAWDAIRKSSFFMEYQRLLPSTT